MRYKNPTCETSVTTPTGTFTYFSKEVSPCQAKLECLKRGQILAPITNARDRDALRSIAKLEDRSCKFHWGYRKYHIGLDVKKCGNRIYRIFTNNVVYNKTLHGDLYKWRGNKSEDTNRATYTPYYEKLFVVTDYGMSDKLRFICLKPSANSSTAEPMIEREVVYNSSSNMMFVLGAFVVAFVGFMLMLSSKNKNKVENKEMMKLKNEIDSLKNENSYYKEEYEKMLNKVAT